MEAARAVPLAQRTMIKTFMVMVYSIITFNVLRFLRIIVFTARVRKERS